VSPEVAFAIGFVCGAIGLPLLFFFLDWLAGTGS
jgi:hypothetical protein